MVMPQDNIFRGVLGTDGLQDQSMEVAPDSFDLGLRNIQSTFVEKMIEQFPPMKIQTVTLDEKKLKADIKQWYNIDTQDSYRTDFLQKCKKYHEAYLGYMTPTSFPWENCSNLDLGIIEMAVDNIKARFKVSTVGETPMFSAVPTSIFGEKMKDEVEDLMTGVLDQHIKMESEADGICQDTVELGNCIVKRRWSREKRKVKVFVQDVIPVRFKTPFLNMLNQDVPQTRIEEKEIVYEQAKIERVSLEKWIFPAGTTELDPDKMHHVMQEFELTEIELEDLFSMDDSYRKDTLPTLKEHLKKQSDQTKNPKNTRNQKLNTQLPVPVLRCVEVYVKAKHQDCPYAEELIITWAIDADTIIRIVRLVDLYFDGHRPFKWFRYKSSGRPYGRGIAEMLYQYREGLNTIFNLSINSMMLQILPWGFYRYSSSFNPEEHKLAPGVWVPLDDINDARPAQFPPTSRLADSAISLLISLVERQTGISAPHMGQMETGRKTAFEIKAVLSEGNVKHQERIESFQHQFGELLRGIYDLYRYNIPDNQTFRKLNDAAGRPLKNAKFSQSPSRYQLADLDFDFIILGSMTTGNKAIERQDSIELAGTLLKFPIVAENPAAQIELAKDIATSYGKRDVERFLPPEAVADALRVMKVEELMQIAAGKREVAGPGGPRGPIPTAA